MANYNQQAMRDAEAYLGTPAIMDTVSARQAFLAKVYGTVGMGLLTAGLACFATLNSPSLMGATVGLMSNWLFYILAIVGITLGVQAVSQVPVLNVVAYAIYTFFLGMLTAPLVYMVTKTAGPATVVNALIITTALCAGLSMWALSTKEDLSGWGRFLQIGAFLMLGVVIVALIMGMSVGLWYNAVWVALLAGFIMYETQMIQRRYPVEMWMSAAIALSTDFIVMFWHILSLLGGSRR